MAEKDLSKETEKKIAQLQFLEQSLQTFLMQKQTFQSQCIEIDNAIAELEKTEGPAYKIMGTVMVKAKKEDLKNDLASRKEEIDLRIKSIERQETKLKEKASTLQAEILGQIKNNQIEGYKERKKNE